MFRHALSPLVFGILIAIVGSASAATVAVGETVQGALTEASPSTADGKFQETLTLPITEGQIVVIDLISTEFDPYLRVTTPSGDVLVNDDGGEGINSRLTFLAEHDGEAQIVATSYGSGATGAFTLSVTEPELAALQAGEPFMGSIDGVAAHTLSVTEGDLLVIDCTSEDFDTILGLRGPEGASVENDDISSGDRNSRLIYSSPVDGRAIVTVSSYTGSGGDYTLECATLDPSEWMDYAEGQTTTLEGQFTEVSPEALIGIRAPAGTEVQVDVSSESIDPMITVYSDAGWSKTDDDSGMGMNSLLQFEMPASGQVVLQVNSFNGDEVGAYTVTLSPKVNPVAPAFSLETITGDVVTSNQFDGQIRIIDFWATWCPPCIAEIPHFNEIAAEYASRGVSVIGISLDARSEDVVAFLEDNEVGYTIVMDDAAVSTAYGSLTEEGELRYIPTTFVVDREGSIVNVHTGYSAKEEFVAEIEALLASDE